MWDEETEEAAETFGESELPLFPEIHRFTVPDGCHWRDIRETSSNVGTALLRAMQEIERANPDTLYRVFGTADWGNKEKFGDELLKDLIEGFSSIPLGNKAVSTDVLGTDEEVDTDSAGSANTDNVFRYDSGGGNYAYNLDTSGLGGGTYRAEIHTDDGEVHVVRFSLK